MDQLLPGGADNELYLSLFRTEFDPVAPGAIISANAPSGIDFANASVTATDSGAPASPGRDLATTVSPDGRNITWTVPDDTPPGSGLLFELTGAQAPGYTAWNFDDTFSLELDVEVGGAGQDINSLGLGGAFFTSDWRGFYGGASVIWRLPSSSVALDQLVDGTGGEARFGGPSGAFIPVGEAGEDLPASASADGQTLTVTLPNRSETFTLAIYTGSAAPPLSDLHSLTFVYDTVSVTEYLPCQPTDQVIGAIRERYVSLDGPCGVLGDPLTAELATPVRFGRFNHFEGGSIYWSPATGAWEVHGAIRETWSRLGWENGAVGFPVTNETPTPNKFGRYNHFQAGSIYWSPSTGAREVRGAIRDTWSRLGWENGILGFPVTDETATPTKPGAYNHFQAGSIYWSPGTGAREVRGAIRAQWAALGWENSSLGFPTSDEYGIPGGRRSDFQGGSITWTPFGGTKVMLAGR